MEKVEYFPQIKQIQYDGNSKNDQFLVFKYYNPDTQIMGKTMAEWCRFSVCYWHTFRGNGSDMFGDPTREFLQNETNEIEFAKRRLEAAFEFMQKLQIKFWTFHDRDIAPVGANLEETNKNLDIIVDHALQLQKQTGIKLLWGTANLFSHFRYMNGASTNPDPHVFAYAAAQVRKAMEVTHKLGGQNYVFWGGREGYQSLLNTNVRKELDNMSAFFHMAVNYKNQIGFTGQLLIEPKPKEPTKHQYDYDGQTVISFLKTYGLDQHFKLNIEPNHTTLAGHCYEHDIKIASDFGMLGSIDANTGDQSLGWDTDQFPMSIRDATYVMLVVLQQGGIGSGGLNFDCKVRRESTNKEDMFLGHIGAMDTFARGLLNAQRIIEEGILQNMIKQRYSGYEEGLGKKIAEGKATFEECEEFIKQNGEPKQMSGQQEKYEILFNKYTL